MERAVSTIPQAMVAGIEFFLMNGEIQFIQDGVHYSFAEMDVAVAAKLREIMDNDPKVINGLQILGITNPIEQIKQFIFCRFGEFDKVADITDEGVVNTEYWECGNRPCPADGLLCRLPAVPNGKLTRHEADLIRDVAADASSKIIADRLGRSQDTINTQLKTIRRKLGVLTPAGVASFAGQHNLL